ADLFLGQREGRGDFAKELEHLLGLLGFVTAVVGPQDFVGLGVHDHGLDRGAADVEADDDFSRELLLRGHQFAFPVATACRLNSGRVARWSRRSASESCSRYSAMPLPK